jgi:hypothetical protein
VTRHEPPNGRRPPRRRTRPLILIVCASRRTESDYLRGLRDQSGNPAVDILLRKHGRSPNQAIEYARKFVQGDQRNFDEIWCVVDVDDFDIDEAANTARRAKVSLAVSNPCFELWLLLHHADCTAYCDGYEGVAARLKKHVHDYDKTRLNFARYRNGVDDAVRRATALDPSGQEFGRNPSTNVWQLVERIRER